MDSHLSLFKCYLSIVLFCFSLKKKHTPTISVFCHSKWHSFESFMCWDLEFSALTADTVCVGLARVGAEDQKIVAGTLQQLASVDLGGPLHSLVIPGDMHPLELDMLRLFALDDTVKSLLSSSE